VPKVEEDTRQEEEKQLIQAGSCLIFLLDIHLAKDFPPHPSLTSESWPFMPVLLLSLITLDVPL
jgi:hypothetical protein